MNLSLSEVVKDNQSRVVHSQRTHASSACKGICKILHSSVCMKVLECCMLFSFWKIILDPKDIEVNMMDLKSVRLAFKPLSLKCVLRAPIFALAFSLLWCVQIKVL